VQQILRAQFSGLSVREVGRIPKQLRNPLKYLFRSILFVAEDTRSRVQGFALPFHDLVLRFCFPDYLSAAESRTGRGIGGALYQWIRQEALSLYVIGLFFESLPDYPVLSTDPRIRRLGLPSKNTLWKKWIGKRRRNHAPRMLIDS
jgi:hypothetical protein